MSSPPPVPPPPPPPPLPSAPLPADPADEPVRIALARRVMRFEEVLDSRMATTVRRLPYGTARLTPELSWVWSLNHVEVERPVAVSELRRSLDAIHEAAGLRHRMVRTSVPEVAWTLSSALVGDGWTSNRTVYMVHDGVTPPRTAPLEIASVDLETWAGSADAFVADEPWGRDPAVQREMAGRDRLLRARVDARFLLSADGRAGCHVYQHGPIAQIENVHVLTEARGEGLGRALMATAITACADSQTVFLIADADDWPRAWYARLGFVPVATGWEWVLPATSSKA